MRSEGVEQMSKPSAAVSFACDVATLERSVGAPGYYTARLASFIAYLHLLDESGQHHGSPEPKLDKQTAEATAVRN